MRTLLALLLLFAAALAHAHKPSDSYLAIRAEGANLSGQWDIALRDLDFAIGLDDSGDGDITWGEVKAHQADIAAYALARLKLRSGDADCPAHTTEFLVDDHSDGAYSVMRFAATCPREVTTLEITYSLFADLDPQHRGLLRLEHGVATRTAIFDFGRARRAEQRLSRGARSALDGRFRLRADSRLRFCQRSERPRAASGRAAHCARRVQSGRGSRPARDRERVPAVCVRAEGELVLPAPSLRRGVHRHRRSRRSLAHRAGVQHEDHQPLTNRACDPTSDRHGSPL